ncbi:hypothetical protein Metho_0677 [Methanomethylovorans hollandica DSM 15978]|uniref:Uncharacterized protein n=1 Tax=Methanomethylovorans hollandica (strain DSM 15978 / NBRC 107637 / DMS1) TaxID=867904 RepID=L0KXX5_METHD|nr:hypothetical protein [Methanomethylovorans hollandica]AGB48933.1 hypothetical protein Metho_0677 [Methanomethylovorans hollandica DSM 15978]
MTEIRDLQTTAAELYNSVENKKWIFTHTRNETEYYAIRNALKVLSNWQPVEWQGEPGERVPVEV